MINYGVFAGLTNLQKVSIPSSVESIGSGAFYGCTSLAEISRPEGLQIIRDEAFGNCTSLTSVTLPDSLQQIATDAFPSTTSISYPCDSFVDMDDGYCYNVVSLDLTLEENYKLAFQALSKVNAKRKSAGLDALTMDRDLLEAAMLRAAETAVHWSHTRPNGSRCFSVISTSDGENILVGASTASQAVSGWMNSDCHRDNILFTSYDATGIGCVVLNGTYYWVQIFSITDTYSGETITQAAKSSYSNKTVTRTVYASKSADIYGLRAYLTSSSTTLEEGKTTKVTARWYNGRHSIDLAAKQVKYESSNTKVFKVSSSGKITAVGAGTAKLKVWLPGYKDGAVTIKIKVKSSADVKNSRQISFFINDGHLISVYSTKTVTSGKSIGKLPTVTRKGYAFKGWYTAETGGKKISSKTRITKNISFYAHWIRVTKPSRVTVSSVSSSAAGKLTITCKAVSGAKGYQVAYSTNQKSFKTRNFSSRKITLKGLTSGTKYYIKVRAYKKDSTGNKIYGKYSKVKSITIK